MEGFVYIKIKAYRGVRRGAPGAVEDDDADADDCYGSPAIQSAARWSHRAQPNVMV